MAIEYESEPRHWDDDPEEYTCIEGPYRVEKLKIRIWLELNCKLQYQIGRLEK